MEELLEAGSSTKPSESQPDSGPFFTPPTYTMKEIHAAIPPHCFERNTLLSLGYVLQDLTLITILLLLTTQISRLPASLHLISWLIYSILQGLMFTGLWELAHESGHGALSPHKWVNHSIGLFIHSFLLVPFHSWRFTHSTHHKSTNNLERDIAFVPNIKEDWLAARASREPKALFTYWDMIEDMPLVNFSILVGHQLIAWPVYLILNNFALPRMRKFSWWTRSHFYFGEEGPNFKPANRRDIIVSDIGVGVVVALLWAAVRVLGWKRVGLLYGAPWLWTNHWILTITFLQHIDPQLPYYPSKTWSFLRGAASTIDRDFGFIGRHIFHGTVDHHVLHHHASKIPFYHAAEASAAIQKVMGTHYKNDIKTPYLWAFWKNYTSCFFVEEKDQGSGVYFFGRKVKGM